MSQNQYTVSEGRFKGYDGINLYFQSWQNPRARGNIILTPGHGEHTECYRRVVDALKDSDWSIHAWDLRGHGRSEGSRGYAASFDDYGKDYVEFLKLMLKRPEITKGPVVFMSHSMGCLVQTKVMMQNLEFKPDALVLSSPLFGIGVEVPAFKKVGAQWLKRLLPTVTMWNEVTNESVTRDPEIIREFERDPFRHARICAGVYLGFLESFPYVQSHAGVITTKTLMQISDVDQVVSSGEAMKFFENMGAKDKELKVYPGAKHELYNDIIREQAFDDLRKFLNSVQKVG